jgi:hypothetical protein
VHGMHAGLLRMRMMDAFSLCRVLQGEFDMLVLEGANLRIYAMYLVLCSVAEY